MSSSSRVNYAARPSKSIQRELVFGALRSVFLGAPEPLVYVGFGAFWFTDFLLAQQFLSPHRMVSIEKDRTIYRRARFNVPFANVDVKLGDSTHVLPRLLRTRLLRTSWPIFWLDYERSYSPDIETDIETVVRTTESSIGFACHLSCWGEPLWEAGATSDPVGEFVPPA